MRNECGDTYLPTISTFFGIVIRMYYDEHAPPHFHVHYGEYAAVFDIKTLGIRNGKLPRRAVGLVLEWAIEHRQELLEDWNLAE